MKKRIMLLISLVLVARLGASQSESSSKEFYRYNNVVIIESQADNSFELRDASGEGIRKIRNLGKPEFIAARKNRLLAQYPEAIHIIDLDDPMSNDPDNAEVFALPEQLNDYIVNDVSAGINLMVLDNRQSTYFGHRYSSCLYERATGKVLKVFAPGYGHIRFLPRNIICARRTEDSVMGIEYVDCGVRPVRTIACSGDQSYRHINNDYILYIDGEHNNKLVVIDLALKKARRLADGCSSLQMSPDWTSVTVFRNNGLSVSYDLSSIDFSQDDDNN